MNFKPHLHGIDYEGSRQVLVRARAYLLHWRYTCLQRIVGRHRFTKRPGWNASKWV